ncbi:P-II family nitrogen regulator [Immundisolibacter sp.]|jgi:nitrogen regulatory protein P-II 1|uniref:P-II family nitrogen regulator n=1 Tax=Immundisolibacter sp. TaxID=1934948 RepID=UPI001998130A|nr:P-II family nitrogen regulator [Immundisolibacter sp.]MBC7161136.1 P-II family nitrogen regulator [Immundisolibacter sp.]MEA3219334.1 Nitrogen regulatory protein P-II [Immundisolibacter sp.]
MKLIKAFIHHVRTPDVIQALTDAGFRNLTLQDVRGTLKPLPLEERDYSIDMPGLVISEVRLSLVVEDAQVDTVTGIIRRVAPIGPSVSGWVYVSPVEQALPIGGPP